MHGTACRWDGGFHDKLLRAGHGAATHLSIATLVGVVLVVVLVASSAQLPSDQGRRMATTPPLL